MKKCIIIGAGDFFGMIPDINEGDFVIAADAGYINCLAAGISPDLAVGDWDSAPAPTGVERIDLPVEKDDTDTLAAIRIGLEKGFDEFHIFGGTGGRIDHTFANMQCLVFLSKRGKRGFLHDENAVITAITDGRIELLPLESGDVSVFSVDGTAEGVSVIGLKYRADDIALTADFPLGVSNSFVGRPAVIEVKRGTLLAVLPCAAIK